MPIVATVAPGDALVVDSPISPSLLVSPDDWMFNGSTFSTPVFPLGMTLPSSQIPADPFEPHDSTALQLSSPTVSPGTTVLSESDTVRVPGQASSGLRSKYGQPYAAPVSQIKGRGGRRGGRGKVRQSMQRESPSQSQKRRHDSNLEDDCICTCSDAASLTLLSALERMQQTHTAEDIEIAVQYGAQQDAFCSKHRRMYAAWATTGIVHSQQFKDGVYFSTFKRPTSYLEDTPSPTMKRGRLSSPVVLS